MKFASLLIDMNFIGQAEPQRTLRKPSCLRQVVDIFRNNLLPMMVFNALQHQNILKILYL